MKNFRQHALGFLAGILISTASIALAATFTKFSPATGILKGSSSTYVTTAAASTDITATFSGTCNSTTFLRGDGACAAPSGTAPGGADTQVQFNDGGAFGGDADLTWNKTTNLLTVGSVATPATIAAPAGSSSAGANLTIQSGAGNGGNNIAGSINITVGASVGSGSGPQFNLTGGLGGATGAGGPLSLSAGAGGATSGAGGDVTVNGGAATDGNGGSVSLVAKNGTGTNRSGGNVGLFAGTATGSGTAGHLFLVNMTSTGAQTATFSATNKPGSGTTSPSLWWRVDVGGTTYYIPMWQ